MSFLNALKISSYLHDKGYRVCQSTIYSHIKAGYLKKGDEGVYTLKDVERYAEKHLSGSGHKPLKFTIDHLPEDVKRLVNKVLRIILSNDIVCQNVLKAQINSLYTIVEDRENVERE